MAATAVSKQFAGLTALQGVDLTLALGNRIGLIGPNGSGKTTLVNILSGFVRPTTGRLVVGAHDVTGWPPHRIARLGVGRTFQHTRLFGRLTALENVEVGAIRARRTAVTNMNATPVAHNPLNGKAQSGRCGSRHAVALGKISGTLW